MLVANLALPDNDAGFAKTMGTKKPTPSHDRKNAGFQVIKPVCAGISRRQ